MVPRTRLRLSALACLALLAGLADCGDDTDDPSVGGAGTTEANAKDTSENTPDESADPQEVQTAFEAAQQQAASGSEFTIVTTIDSPSGSGTVTDTGLTTATDRRVERSVDTADGSYSGSLAILADQAFVQRSTWPASVRTCWVQVPTDEILDVTGDLFSTRPPFAGIDLVGSASFTGPGSAPGSVAAQVPGQEALGVLGYAAASVDQPVSVDFSMADGAVTGWTLSGAEVLQQLGDVPGLDDRQRASVDLTTATAELSPAGDAQVSAVPEDLVLNREQFDTGETCLG